jgi:iron complex outermembrane receptor protein
MTKPFKLPMPNRQCALLGVSVMTLVPAFAQTSVPAEAAATTDTGVMQTVVVPGHAPQAGNRAGKLVVGSARAPIDIPFAVSSIPGDRMRDQAGTTLQDALRNVPGAQADSGFNGSHAQSFILRGAVADSGTGANRVLRDGVRVSNYPYVPAFIDSVDVLRGPGAAVGMRSEPGGTVNIVTRQPDMANAGMVLVSAGAHDAQELTVDLNRLISAEDELAARIIATRSRASEWRHVPDQLDGIKLAASATNCAPGSRRPTRCIGPTMAFLRSAAGRSTFHRTASSASRSAIRPRTTACLSCMRMSRSPTRCALRWTPPICARMRPR